jgi:hypothetical protein
LLVDSHQDCIDARDQYSGVLARRQGPSAYHGFIPHVRGNWALTCANAAGFIPWISREGRLRAAFGGIWLRVASVADQRERPGQRVDDLVWRARPAGFEPATVGLEVRCSVQLS